MSSRKKRPLLECPIRTCYSLHECCLCFGEIIANDEYYDGGYGNRAHIGCVVPPPMIVVYKNEENLACGEDGEPYYINGEEKQDA
jgi:hypothetical protein